MTASAHHRARVLLRTLLMASAAALLVWRMGDTWTWVLFGATGSLLVTVLVLPRAAAPIGAFFDRTETALLQAVTWSLFALVFCLIFVPGRLFISLRSGKATGTSPDSFWRPHSDGHSDHGGFDRQF